MFGLTGDRSRMPEIAARRRNALHVQVAGDSERAFTGRIFKEDPADDVGPIGIDLSQAANHAALVVKAVGLPVAISRSEEHTSELQSLMRISYAVFCLKKKKKKTV